MRRFKPSGTAQALWLIVCGYVVFFSTGERAGLGLESLPTAYSVVALAVFVAALVGLVVTRKQLHEVTTYTVEEEGLRRANNRGLDELVPFDAIKEVNTARASVVVPGLYLRVHLHSGEAWDISWQAETKRENPEFEEFGRVLTQRVRAREV